MPSGDWDPAVLKGRLQDRFCSLDTARWLPAFQKFEALPMDLRSVQHTELSRPLTTLELKTSGLTGKITGYSQTVASASSKLVMDAKSSTSLDRAPAEHSSMIRGKSTYFPFRPGGLPSSYQILEDESEDIVVRTEQGFEDAFGGIQSCPPGFEHGLDFDADQDDPNLLLMEPSQIKPIYRPLLGRTAEEQVNGNHSATAVPQLHPEVDQLLASERLTAFNTPATNQRKKAAVAKRDWAHVVDVSKEMRNFHQLVPDMAKTYPFELDNFQREAVYHMESGDSVFVAAHTSAGKTVVAEYAIALAIKHMTRAIYTSPIKALSNQKFRDFKDTFGVENVGILTGDVQINPEASCLIMTTEILRSMLYKGADLIRDIEWVIFDEVHYVNDLERGVVWEEVIIMLPAHVGLVLLSATVPNTKEFANWVGRTQQKDIYVISTPKRPVPLEHFLYAGRDMHQVLTATGDFQEKGIKAAVESLRRKQDKEREAAGLPPVGATAVGRGGARGSVRGRGGTTFNKARGGFRTCAQQDRNLWIHLVGVLRTKKLLPVVIFTFSKRRCEEQAASMPNTDLCSAAEKSEIHVVIERSLVRLKGSDRKLPQIIRMRGLLGRGIGIHHGGMLPIVKEMVEILFARGLVKVLFATETFAMGVNMPARCVVFANLRKHDGRSFRDLLPGEYTQMSGRAGRRGLDATGVVLIVCDGEVPDASQLHKVLLGSATKLTSQFRLTYNMILNLLRVEALRVQDMIRKSFSENAAQRLLPVHEKQVAATEKRLGLMAALAEISEEARQVYTLNKGLARLQRELLVASSATVAANKLLSPGRVVIVRDEIYHGHIGVVLRTAPSTVGDAGDFIKNYTLCVLGSASQTFTGSSALPPIWPLPGSLLHDGTQVETITLPVTSFSLITDRSIKVNASALSGPETQTGEAQAISEQLARIRETMQQSLPTEVDLTKVKEFGVRELLKDRDQQLSRLQGMKVAWTKEFLDDYQNIHAERTLKDEIAHLRLAVSDENLDLNPDYQARIAVLQKLLFIDSNNTVLLKGRVACEINSVNELILTELILENVFASFEPEEVVALLSCLVFREKSDEEPYLTPNLERGRTMLIGIADKVNALQSKHRADTLGEGSNTELKFGLMEVVYEWARGTPFIQISELTDVQEGTIVQAITRLSETCREVRDAGRVIGDAMLFQKMEKCRTMIARDVVFCGSLYL